MADLPTVIKHACRPCKSIDLYRVANDALYMNK